MNLVTDQWWQATTTHERRTTSATMSRPDMCIKTAIIPLSDWSHGVKYSCLLPRSSPLFEGDIVRCPRSPRLLVDRYIKQMSDVHVRYSGNMRDSLLILAALVCYTEFTQPVHLPLHNALVQHAKVGQDSLNSSVMSTTKGTIQNIDAGQFHDEVVNGSDLGVTGTTTKMVEEDIERLKVTVNGVISDVKDTVSTENPGKTKESIKQILGRLNI
ncbi:uncharacterized protein LOC143774245 [Ranitomeya variabilis]|uniref:uncharacterized protein LOC143774245 n=1 Tax=Ranitomeya variabilis TaxID=490064 RepID=UPI0040569645